MRRKTKKLRKTWYIALTFEEAKVIIMLKFFSDDILLHVFFFPPFLWIGPLVYELIDLDFQANDKALALRPQLAELKNKYIYSFSLIFRRRGKKTRKFLKKRKFSNNANALKKSKKNGICSPRKFLVGLHFNDNA